MAHASCRVAFVFMVVIGGALFVAAKSSAQAPNGGGPRGGNGQQGGGQHDDRPTYRRHGFDWRDKGRDWRREDFRRSWNGPQMSSGWFQRPYPFHLDYYKMKWGGSYAPYFGNLYGTPFGTPAVVNGGWGIGAGGWGAEPSIQPQGVEGSVWVPYALPQGTVSEQPNGTGVQSGTAQPGNETLPAPTK